MIDEGIKNRIERTLANNSIRGIYKDVIMYVDQSRLDKAANTVRIDLVSLNNRVNSCIDNFKENTYDNLDQLEYIYKNTFDRMKLEGELNIYTGILNYDIIANLIVTQDLVKEKIHNLYETLDEYRLSEHHTGKFMSLWSDIWGYFNDASITIKDEEHLLDLKKRAEDMFKEYKITEETMNKVRTCIGKKVNTNAYFQSFPRLLKAYDYMTWYMKEIKEMNI